MTSNDELLGKYAATYKDGKNIRHMFGNLVASIHMSEMYLAEYTRADKQKTRDEIRKNLVKRRQLLAEYILLLDDFPSFRENEMTCYIGGIVSDYIKAKYLELRGEPLNLTNEEKHMDIVLATRNVSKVEQIKAVLAGLPIRILSLDEAGVSGEAVEDGTTLQENALKKARYAFAASGGKLLTIAEDSGTFINALGGAPGIRSARWAGENATTKDITDLTLARLEGVTDRTAYLEAVVALIMPDGQEYFFGGKATGRILEDPRTEPQPMMPYSGIFACDANGKVWAEMSVDEENLVSHRGEAFRQVREFLEKIL